MGAAILFICLFGLLALSVPVGFALGISSLVYLVFEQGTPIMAAMQRVVVASDSFSLMALPLFIISGNLMCDGGISKRLINFIDALIGWARGGLAIVTTVACAFFGAISGSNTATTAAIGSIMIPGMKDKNYDTDFAAAVTASSGVLGAIIPPSLMMISYGTVTGASIGSLFMGGVIPGIIIAILFCILNHFIAKKEGVKKSDVHYTAKEVLTSTVKALPVLFMPVMVLGGIYGGIFTPTEAATICVIYSCLLSIAYKEMNFKKFWEIIKRTIVSSATIALVIGISSVFGLALATANIPNKVAQALVPILHNKTIYLLVLIAFLALVGTLMETLAAIVIIAPILTPIGIQLGCDPLHLGVLFCIVLVIGFITPPFGVNLFTAVSTTNTPYVKVVKGVWPFIIVGFAALFLFAFVPEIITFLPSLT